MKSFRAQVGVRTDDVRPTDAVGVLLGTGLAVWVEA